MDQVIKYADRNIGVILPSTENSQLAYEVITSINNEIADASPYDYRVFFENFGNQCVHPTFATMNVGELWHYSGLLISTTVDNTRLAMKLVGPIRLVFYVWDVEFIRQKDSFFENMEVYKNPQVKLIARSESHAQAIQNYCNRRPNFIMENIALAELAKVI